MFCLDFVQGNDVNFFGLEMAPDLGDIGVDVNATNVERRGEIGAFERDNAGSYVPTNDYGRFGARISID